MKFLSFSLCMAMAAVVITAGCTDAEQPVLDSTKKPLNIDIHNSLYTKGGVISESYLPNASVVGIFLQKDDGTQYDNLPYDNIPYVARGTAATQTWAPQSAEKQILLSATEGKAYAYFPYKAENTSFTAIHLDATRQDDVMYTSTASTGLNDRNADASFNLQHALAVMKVKVKKGSYTGTGAVTSCSIYGSPIGLTGKLDGTTGKLSGVTTGTVSVNKSYKISTTATDHDIIFVPTTTAGQVTVGLMMDGKEYTTTTTSSETFVSNQCYTLNLTVDDSGATLTGIEVGDWTISGEGNSIVTAGGYKITFEGDYSGMAFSVSESGANVTLSACSMDPEKRPLPVSVSGASFSETTSNHVRIITISDISRNVVVTFDGIAFPTISWAEAKASDGVYGIYDNMPVEYEVASKTNEKLSGVAIVMYGRAMQIAHTWHGSGNWGDSANDLSDLPNLTKVGGGVSGAYGYLIRPDGSYASSSGKITTAYTEWLNYPKTALADTSGWANTEVFYIPWIAGPKVYVELIRNNPDVNLGYNDWYLPAAGQMAYVYLNKGKIDTLTYKCGVSPIPIDEYYWTSSEYGSSYAWIVNLEYGQVSGNGVGGNYPKTDYCNFLFMRDIKE